MVSIDRDYDRVLLYDPIPKARHSLTAYLQATPSPRAATTLEPYLTSLDGAAMSGPYALHAEHLTMSGARTLLEVDDFELPGAIVLALHASKMAGFVSISTLLLDAGLSARVPVVALVGRHDLAHHEKLQRALEQSTGKGISRVIVWEKDNLDNDAALGLRSMPSQLKMIVHRAMCADLAKISVVNAEHHDNGSQMQAAVGEGHQSLAKMGLEKDKTSSLNSQHSPSPINNNNSSDISALSVGGISGPLSPSAPTHQHGPAEATAFSALLFSSAPQTSPLRVPRIDHTKFRYMFRFDRAGRRDQNNLKQGNSNKKKRWHRKHSLGGDDLKKYLKGQNKAPQLSEKMQAKLKGITMTAKKKVKIKPVTAVHRDILQPTYMETPLPLQHVNKQDSLTLKAFNDWKKGNFHACVAGFTDALVIEEFHFYARFYRALCYATIGRYRPALSDMSKCTKIVSKMDPAEGGVGPGCDPPERLRFVCYFNLALLHLNVHEHRSAVKCLNVAEKAQPLSPDAAFLRGFVRRRRGLYMQCRSDYVTASKLKLRQDVGAVEASRIEHSFSTDAHRKSRHHHASIVRSPPKKSKILSFLTSVQKSLMTPCTDRTEMHIQYIAAMLTPHSFFGKIDETMRMKLCQDIEYRTCEQGEWIFRRGDPSDALYLCLSGRLNVMVTNPGMLTETHGGTLKKGDTFGELGVLHGEERSASVVVNAAAELCVIPAWLFEIVGLGPAMRQVNQDKRDAIVESKILRGLPDHFIREATSYATIRIYEQGEKLVEQGQHAECVFVILKGICEVWQRIDIRGEMVRRRKALLDETESLAKRYVYHHQVVYHTEGDSADPSATGVGGDTALESKRNRLLRELAQVDGTIKQLDREKMKNYRKMSRWKRMMMENNSASKLNAQGAEIKKVRLREIMKPSYFGDGAIPGDGAIEPADVVATTRVKALRIFVPQMDFSKVNDTFLERLKTLSAVRPLSLDELTQRARGEEGWVKYRKHSMEFIGKSKWPLRGEATVTAGASGTSYIHPLPLPHGYLRDVHSKK